MVKSRAYLIAAFITLSLILTACVIPVTDQVTDGYNSRFSDESTVFFLHKVEQYVVVHYSPGEFDHEEPVLIIIGDNLEYNSSECVADGNRLDCRPGVFIDGVRTMTTDMVFEMAMLGRNIVANVSYRHVGEDYSYSQIAEIQ